MLSLILDTETTGLNPHEDRIVELAFILTDWKEIYGALRTYVNPLYSFTNSISNINDKTVENSPTFAQLLPFTYNLLLYADEYVAHNWAFDRNFLMAEVERCALRMPSRMVFDTMKASGGKKLSDACQHYHIDTHDVQWHSALDDAVATLRLCRAIRGGKGPDAGEGGSPAREGSFIVRT